MAEETTFTPISPDELRNAQTCGECGVQVVDLTLHRRWHDQLSREVLKSIRETRIREARREGRPPVWA